jgi:hypothetical protein
MPPKLISRTEIVCKHTDPAQVAPHDGATTAHERQWSEPLGRRLLQRIQFPSKADSPIYWNVSDLK